MRKIQCFNGMDSLICQNAYSTENWDRNSSLYQLHHLVFYLAQIIVMLYGDKQGLWSRIKYRKLQIGFGIGIGIVTHCIGRRCWLKPDGKSKATGSKDVRCLQGTRLQICMLDRMHLRHVSNEPGLYERYSLFDGNYRGLLRGSIRSLYD